MARYVIAVFTDLVKHSEAWKRIPRDPMAALVGEYKHLAETIASQHGLLHSNFTGDGHFFLFEDADAAVRFGLKLVAQWRSAFETLPALQGHEPLPLRVGVHFGDETQLDDGESWVGRCGNVAKRIEDKAEPDTVYASEGVLDFIDLPLYRVTRIGGRTLKGDHLSSRVIYRIDAFDEAKFAAKPEPELTPEDWFLKGVAMIGTADENTDLEAECYEQALRLRPDYPDAHNNYAVLLAERGDVRAAEEHCLEALHLRPDDPDTHYNYANLLKGRADAKGAEEHYKEALRLRPDYAEAHNNYGILLRERGGTEEAEGRFLEALRLRPDYPEAHNNYANLLQGRADVKGAEEHYQEALRLSPDYVDAHNNYAVLLRERGDVKEAEEHYLEALRLRPDYAKAHYNYAILLKAQGHSRKAKRHFEEAFRIEPENPNIRSAFEGQVWRAR